MSSKSPWSRFRSRISGDTTSRETNRQPAAHVPDAFATTANQSNTDDVANALANGSYTGGTGANNEGTPQLPTPTVIEPWHKAIKQLEESKKGLAIIQDLSANNLANISAKDLINEITQEITKQNDRNPGPGTIKVGQDEFSVRRYMEKTIAILNKFVTVGDIASSFDPVHAALPWAAVRFVLVSLTARSEMRDQILFGLAKVTTLFLQCDTYHRLYIAPGDGHQAPKDAVALLEKYIFQSYVKSILFLDFAVQRQQSRFRGFDAPWRLPNIDEHMKNLTESDEGLVRAADNCEKFCNYQNRIETTELLQVAERSRQMLQDQGVLLPNMYQQFVLGKLLAAEGATYDSQENEHDSLCYPGTRVDLLAEIYKWVDDKDGTCVYWLQGMAGTGKSTVSRTVAYNLASRGDLGASFFFKRGRGDRSKAVRFVTTIAAQLVHRHRRLAQSTQNAIESEPSINDKGLMTQFENLVLQPLKDAEMDASLQKTMVVVIDALDECDREEDAQTIIRLFPRVKQLSSLRIKFFVTSRPESSLRSQFDDITDAHQERVLQEIPESIIKADISKFMTAKLAEVRVAYNKKFGYLCDLPADWPGQWKLQKLVNLANPLFIFAALSCSFIKDERYGGAGPEGRLEQIIKNKSSSHTTQLDEMYQLVLTASVKGQAIDELRQVVGSIIILASPLSSSALALLLGIPPVSVVERLSLLHSVLSIPPDPHAPIRVLHQSFPDFLLDEERRRSEFWVDKKKAHESLKTKCLELLCGGWLKEDICGLKMPGKPREAVERQLIDDCLPPQIQYACRYWVYHSKQCESKIQDGDQVHQFLLRHLLHWLEALSLIGRISESIEFIEDLRSLAPRNTEVFQFLHDMKRFVLNYRSMIDQTPLQLYSSALVFAPKSSQVRATFEGKIPRWVSLRTQMDSDWSQYLQILEGHSEEVESVAYSHDSTLIASASRDKTIRIWRASTGELLETLKGHSDRVHSVAFSHNSALIASGSADKTIRVWRVNTGELHWTLEGHMRSVHSVAFSHNSAYIASGCQDKTVKIWCVSTGKLLKTLKGHDGWIWSIAVSHDSELIASAAADRTVRVWRVDTGELQMTLEGQANAVYSVAFSHDSALIAAGSNGYSASYPMIRIWCTSTGERLRTLAANTCESIAFSHESKLIASTNLDTIWIWRHSTGELLQTLKGHSSTVESVAFSNDSALVVSGSWDKTVRIWDISKPQQVIDGHTDLVNSVVFSHDSALIATTSTDKTIRVWRASTGELLDILKGHRKSVNEVAFSHDSSIIASTSSDTTLRTWHRFKPQWVLHGHCGAVGDVIFSPNSALIASTAVDNTIRTWCVNTGKLLETFQTDDNYNAHIDAIAFSHDSALIASSSSDKMVRIWRTSTGECMREIGIGMRSQELSFQPDDFDLLTDAGTIGIYETAAVRPTLNALSNGTHNCPSGYGFCQDRLWITYNGEDLIRVPTGSRVTHYAISGSTIVVCYRSGKVLIIGFSNRELPGVLRSV